MSSFWQDALINTFLLTAGVTLLSALVAVPSAWLLERSDLPGRRTLRQWLTLPYAVPSFLTAISWIVLANPNVGWLKIFVEKTGCPLPINIYSLSGMIFVEASCVYTILLLTLSSSLKKMDPALEEAARMSGAGPFRTFFKITLPLMKGSLFAGLLSVAMATVASFGVPAMIGGPARIFVLTTGIFSLLKEGSPSAMTQAFEIATGISAFALVSGWIVSRTLRRSNAVVTGKSSRASRHRLGRWTAPAVLWAWGTCGVFFVLPALTLVASSFQVDTSRFSSDAFGFRGWRYVFTGLTEFPRALGNSLLLATGSATLIALLSLVLSVQKSRLRSAAETLALGFYSLPGTALALLLIMAASALPGGALLMNGLGILLLAYTLKYFSLGFRAVSSSADLIHPSLIEAARMSGANSIQVLTKIWLPLLRSALGAAFILCLLPSIAELTMSALLYGPGTENLGVLIFQLQEYADRTSAAVIGSLILVFVLLVQSILARIHPEQEMS